MSDSDAVAAALAGAMRAALPASGGTLVGRAWLPAPVPGPAVVSVIGGEVFDLTPRYPTVSDLLEAPDPAAAANAVDGLPHLGPVELLLEASLEPGRDPARARLLAPVDLQAVKACGVTFMVSLIERVIEEQAGGDPRRAQQLRASLSAQIGERLSAVRPGSAQAESLKAALIEQGMWSQYLEVAIGPDAEVFTKCQVLASVGQGACIGIHPRSQWNNPEPEIVLVGDCTGRIAGAALGNDVNLRDFEGRSALLLGKAKDNNASSAIGPFIRLFDESFTMADVRSAVVSLRITGEDGFVLEAESDMEQISRTPEELVAQTCNRHHPFPDGFALFLGTMFAPTQDRDAPGGGFTHKRGDVVAITTPALGTLVNRVELTDRIPPWRYGLRDLYRYLDARGLGGRLQALAGNHSISPRGDPT